MGPIKDNHYFKTELNFSLDYNFIHGKQKEIIFCLFSSSSGVRLAKTTVKYRKQEALSSLYSCASSKFLCHQWIKQNADQCMPTTSLYYFKLFPIFTPLHALVTITVVLRTAQIAKSRVTFQSWLQVLKDEVLRRWRACWSRSVCLIFVSIRSCNVVVCLPFVSIPALVQCVCLWNKWDIIYLCLLMSTTDLWLHNRKRFLLIATATFRRINIRSLQSRSDD